MSKIYCPSLTEYKRFVTREVYIGDVPMGGNNPIRVQSMTTVDTMNTKGSVEQCIRMIEAGCEYIRITAPSKKEAQNLENIKKELRAAGFHTPLVADIHFTPNAAEIAARIVEKVRVNPGNYADKKKFNIIEYTDSQYQAELDRIREKFSPLVQICKQEGTAMRIGTNHGSLSDRILSRYGDTPLGMVESAMEFIRICEDLNYHNLVISMKASNAQVMVQAYRLLVNTMMQNGQAYPLHLGVTEAGDGEDGRIKSAVGIGALLEDGLGDTVRVSLTEDPEAEMPVARKLIQRYSNRNQHQKISPIENYPIQPFQYKRFETKLVSEFGSEKVPVVIADISYADVNDYDTYSQIGYRYNEALDKFSLSDIASDYAYFGSNLPQEVQVPGGLNQIYDSKTWLSFPIEYQENTFPLFQVNNISKHQVSSRINFIGIEASEVEANLAKIKSFHFPFVLVLKTENQHAMPALRRAMVSLHQNDIDVPVVFFRSYDEQDQEQFQLDASADIGALFLDGMGNGISISAPKQRLDLTNSLAFGILQATRTRISKTEYISCPSCGRTLFDLQETTQMIREKTNHLKGIKIGIMGCIVNGPGEMADADYGYVGSGVGKITLYRGQNVVERQIDSENALNKLIDIIKEDGNWVERKEV